MPPETVASAQTSRWLALAILCAGQLMVILDGTVVSVALPSIQDSLGFSQSSLAWVVNAYLIPFGGLLLLSGRVGDLLGRNRIFTIGLVVFTAASLLCGLAQNQEMLLISRFVQGVGGAAASSVTLAMIVTMFSERKEMAQAIGVYSFVQAAGGAIGLIAGGVLTQAINWHWIFFINVPIGIAVVVLAVRKLSSERGLGLGEGTDIAGAVLVTAALMLTVYTIVETTNYRWGSAHTIGFGAGALVLLAAFVTRQAKGVNSLMPLRMFRLRNVSGAMVTQALMISGMFSFQFLVVLYMQKVLGFNEVESGLGVVPVAVLIGLLSLVFAPRLIARFGARTVLLPGLALITVGLGLLSRVPVDGSYFVDVFPATVPLGIGFGLSMPSLAGLAMSGATPEDSGLASGMFNTMQQIGSALGLAVLSTLAASHTKGLIDDGTGAASALTDGYQLAFRVGACFVIGAIVVAAVVLRTPAESKPEAAGPKGAQLTEDEVVSV
ncbi:MULTISPECIES: MFS transporter [unclassified Frankia]|uniref:MFS transporter n=1 Tax=unclassified Frankia TaxID=2632575 RepID=UPI002AD2A8AE|nr:MULTISPECIES: MFS transporter [unclassified Frankia]